MLVKIGQAADHGFDEPLALLSDCHRRIERFLSVLRRIAEAYGGGKLEDADRRALAAALRYFETAAPRHAADEEESLFPRLRTASDPQAQDACDKLTRLEADHRVADEHHAAVHALGTRWLSSGTLASDDARALGERLLTLERLYREHMALEDSELFPAAGRVLNAADLEAVGREMARRRGVAFEPPAGVPR